jgi:hypothetical protein
MLSWHDVAGIGGTILQWFKGIFVKTPRQVDHRPTQDARGGDLIFMAGDGHPGGSGGDVIIGPGYYKAGDGGQNNMTK